MPSWHSTFNHMRGIASTRSWMTWDEFDDFLRRFGLAMSRYHVRKALKDDKPVNSCGIKQYEPRHAVLAAEYAKGKGWWE